MDQEQDRSEQPTAFKLQKAKGRGMVARGMDLGFFISLAAAFAWFWISGPSVGTKMSDLMRAAFVVGPQLAESNGAILGVATLMFQTLMRPLGMLFALVFLSVLVFELVQTGFVFSPQPLKPDISRLNPAKGLKRIFTIRMLIETFKNVLKLVAYGLAALLIVRQALDGPALVIGDALTLATALQAHALKVLGAAVLIALIFAIIDQLIARRQFFKQMRMSRREVKREVRDREGDQRLKQKRKALHDQFVKARQSLRGIRGADVLVTNPTHVAVALRYDGATMPSPKVVSVGTDRLARQLKRLALLYNIPIIEDRNLARALSHACPLGAFVPESCFGPVADIYNGLRRQSRSVRNV